MGKLWKISLFIYLNIFVLNHSALAFVHSKNSAGKNIAWEGAAPSILLYLNPSNNDGMVQSDVISILDNSINQWNASSRAGISRTITTSSPLSGRNDVYFSQSSSFGTGVLAVTSVTYDGPSARIFESDIALNDAIYNFSSTPNSTDNVNQTTIFLGDVLSHELGHLLGLGHSQTRDSSMVFTIFNGHYILKDDDKSGANAIYLKQAQGIISGKVVGGKDLNGIFGANVQVISASTGEVVSSQFSEVGGSFYFFNLPLGDTYYIYVSPLNVSAGPPTFYSSANSSFCSSRESFRGSFFTSCGYSEQGQPQGIALSSSATIVYVGDVTVKCHLETPNNYLDSKDYITRPTLTLDMVHSNGSVGNAVTGYFSDDEQAAAKLDTYQIDLSTYTPTFSDAYLDLKIVTQRLFSPLRATIRVVNADNTYDQTFPSGGGVSLDEFNNPDFNVVARVPLDLDPSKNIFSVIINSQVSTFGGYQKSEVFPAQISNESLGLYLLIATISKKNADSTFTHMSARDYTPYSDNAYCPDAPNTKSFSGFTNNSDLSGALKSEDKSAAPVSCATIDVDSNDGPGPFTGNLVIGFICAFMIMIGFSTRKQRSG